MKDQDLRELISSTYIENDLKTIFILSLQIPDAIFHQNNEIGCVGIYAFNPHTDEYKYSYEASYKRDPRQLKILILQLYTYVEEISKNIQR